MEDIKIYLDFFGVGENVSEQELKTIRNAFLKKYHPDSGCADYEDIAKATNIAYERLLDHITARDRLKAEGMQWPYYAPHPKPGDEQASGESVSTGLVKRNTGFRDHYDDQAAAAYKRLFVDAVLNYTYKASKQRDIGYTCGEYLDVFPLGVFAVWVKKAYPDWEQNRALYWAEIMPKDYKKLFLDAVQEYVKVNNCTVKEALLAFRIAPTKYYYWKASV